MRGVYGAELARIHHDHFGTVARGAAEELLRRLHARGVRAGTVVDLATGSGILCHALSGAGFDVLAVDISEDMLRIARDGAPGARFVQASLWDAELPPCVAVAAVGEAFCYAADPAAGLDAFAARLQAIHAALVPDGVLVFDVASPGRSGPTRERRSSSSHDGTALAFHEREDDDGLLRTIALTMPDGRVVEETHQLRLYAPGDVEAALDRAGFAWERLERYGAFKLLPAWNAYAAVKVA